MFTQNNVCLNCGAALNEMPQWLDLWSLKKMTFPVYCANCMAKFEKCQFEQQCRYCQHPVTSGAVCHDCQRWLSLYDERYLQHQSVYRYNEHFKNWITQYKYNGDLRQAKVMSETLRQLYQQYRHYTWTFLPSSPQNYALRGFNPVEQLLMAAKICYIPFFDYRPQTTSKSQAKKLRSERLALEQPFILKDDVLAQQAVLILDDIYTTGTTLMCAKALLFEKGATDCCSVTLARDILK